MRKPILIQRQPAGSLWHLVARRCNCLDVAHRCCSAKDGVVVLAGDAAKIIGDVLAECQAADAELGFGPDSTESARRDYLKNLIR